MTSDFPTKENPKLCNNGCGRKIYLSNDTGKWLAYNLDDTQHDCRDKDRPYVYLLTTSISISGNG